MKQQDCTGREYGQDAMEEAKNMSHLELATAYADAVSLNAYYGKLENKLSAVPRQLFDKIKTALGQMNADSYCMTLI